MTPQEALQAAQKDIRAARELISDPERWTQHAPARDLGHRPANPWDAFAVRWCGSGAIERRGYTPGAAAALNEASVRLHGYGLVTTNDDPTPGAHGRVLAAYDEALRSVTEDLAAVDKPRPTR